MKLNIFEGARRIEYLLIGVILLSGLVIGFSSEPGLQLSYSLPFPDKAIVKIENEGCDFEDANESTYRTSPKGHSYNLFLCFKAIHLDDGKVLSPYKDQGTILGGDEFSEKAMSYRKEFFNNFHPPLADVSSLDDKYWFLRVADGLESIGIAFGCAIGFWIICWIIGWIVRGFLGISSGKDFKE